MSKSESNTEIAIECDPNLLTFKRLEQIRNIGFNRVSFGLQDFNKKVLGAVERGFPKIEPKKLIEAAKNLGFTGINLDLIYGLPHQTPKSFRTTLEQTIDANKLPSGERKNDMAIDCHNILVGAGYLAIGMDHFAKPEDSLAIALKNKDLHRNFQGYCTKKNTGDVYGIGASSISQLKNGYGQNEKDTKKYIDRVKQGKLPIQKIYVMTNLDKFYKRIINSLMCDGELDLALISKEFDFRLEDVKIMLSKSLNKMKELEQEGLVHILNPNLNYRVTEKGWLVVRYIAMQFDPLTHTKTEVYSHTV